jgi:hypothetical protein
MSLLFLFSGCVKVDNIGQGKNFVKFYGQGSGSDVKQTNDGYVVIGNVSTANRGTDIFLVKTDWYGNQLGNPHFYGSTGNDSCYSLQITTDGGYVIAGSTDTVINGTIGTSIYIIKTNSIGDIEWTKTIGGIDKDVAYFVQNNGSGGYLVTGSTGSFGSGRNDAFLLNLDQNGNLNWMRTYGGGLINVAKCVQVTSDGYIFIGSTAQSNSNILVIKTNTLGLIEQTTKIGGINNITGEYIQVLPDGSYLGLGTKLASGNSYSDIYLFKLDKNINNLIWSQDFGGSAGNDLGKSVQLTSDSNYVIGGTHQNADNSSSFYLIKTDNLGNILFSNYYGQGSSLSTSNLVQTSDDGFIMAGTNKTQGYEAITLIKVGPEGKL